MRSAIQILIADDMPTNVNLLKKYLERLPLRDKIEITTVKNGAEAVQAAKSKNDQKLEFTLIFMDIQMPVMNGIEAARRIKAFAPNTKIIAHTAMSTGGELEKLSSNSDFIEILPKPCPNLESHVVKYLPQLCDKSAEPINHKSPIFEHKALTAMAAQKRLIAAARSVAAPSPTVKNVVGGNRPLAFSAPTPHRRLPPHKANSSTLHNNPHLLLPRTHPNRTRSLALACHTNERNVPF